MTLREEETVKEQLNSDLLDRLSLKGLLQVRKETTSGLSMPEWRPYLPSLGPRLIYFRFIFPTPGLNYHHLPEKLCV